MDFLHKHLLMDLQIGQEETVYQIEQRIRAKGEGEICPRDGKPGAAYVDVAEDSYASTADIMLSYTWAYKITEIVSALEKYCEKKGFVFERTCIWICCFCVNQHRVQEQRTAGNDVSVTEFMELFGQRVRTTRHIVGLLSPWNEPKYVKRVWCLFEAWKASRANNVALDFMLPESEVEAFQHSLMDNGLDNIWKALSAIKVEKAEASVPQDRDRIHELIQEESGYEALDKLIRVKLQSWFVDAACETPQARDGPDFQPAVCAKIADLMTQLGENQKCAAFLKATIGFCEKRGPNQTREQKIELAMLHVRLGRNFGTGGDQAEAGEQCKRAYALCQQARRASMDCTIHEAEVLRTLASISRKNGDLLEAFDQYSKALAVYEMHKEGDLLKLDSGWILLNLGIVWGLIKAEQQATPSSKITGYKDLDDFGFYDKAWEVYESHGKQGEPAAAWVLRNRGVSYTREKDFVKAKEDFDLAQRIYEEHGLTTVENFGELRKSQGMLHLEQGHVEEAIDCLEEARKILRKVMGKDHALVNSLNGLVHLYIERDDRGSAIEARRKEHEVAAKLMCPNRITVHDQKRRSWFRGLLQQSFGVEADDECGKQKLLGAFRKALGSSCDWTSLQQVFRKLGGPVLSDELEGILSKENITTRELATGRVLINLERFVDYLYADSSSPMRSQTSTPKSSVTRADVPGRPNFQACKP